MKLNGAIVDGNITPKTIQLRGNVVMTNGRPSTVLWGTITGNIELQEDLMEKLYSQKAEALSVQEIEAILYLD